MKIVATLAAVAAAILAFGTQAQERSIVREVLVKAPVEEVYKAWDSVLGNLQKRFVSGPVDWTEWLARMKAFSDKK